jgi:hypothetical protein
MSTQTLRGIRGQRVVTFDFRRPDARSNEGERAGVLRSRLVCVLYR